MRTIVETDPTTVRVKQHSTRSKRKAILVLISFGLICIILVFLGYVLQDNGNNSKEPRQNNHVPLEESIYSVTNNNNGKYRSNFSHH